MNNSVGDQQAYHGSDVKPVASKGATNAQSDTGIVEIDVKGRTGVPDKTDAGAGGLETFRRSGPVSVHSSGQRQSTGCTQKPSFKVRCL